MTAEDSKQKEDTTTSADPKSVSMSQMMSQMMNKCCTGEGGFPACFSMMKDIMKPVKDRSPQPPQEPKVESEEKKK